MAPLFTALLVILMTSAVAQTGSSTAASTEPASAISDQTHNKVAARIEPASAISNQASNQVARSEPASTITVSQQDINRLYLLGKVWGLLKYHHPAIAGGKYDWDKELISFLPGYRGADKRSGNDSLLAWVNRLGKVPACDTCTDSDKQHIASRPDSKWINSAGFSKPLAQTLQEIQQRGARGSQHYVRFMTEDDIHVAAFDHENAYGSMTYPAEAYRLLALFRYWNIIEYYYPYKYDLGQTWDAVLKQFIPLIIAAKDATEYAAVIRRLIATIRDSHAVVQARIISEEQGSYTLPCWIKFIEGKAVVIDPLPDSLATLSGIQRGDIIDSIDGVAVSTLVQRHRPFISASNEASYLSLLRNTLIRSRRAQSALSIERAGQQRSLTTHNLYSRTTPRIRYGTFSYERDSSLCRINDSVGYVNLGNFQRKDSTKLRALVSSVRGLIIDNRQYPKTMSAGDLVAGCILQGEAAPFVKFTSPDPDRPGRFVYSKPTNMGAQGIGGSVPPRIAILINEETISSTEFQAMLFRKAKGAVLIGTPTAGADGNVALIALPGNIYTYISGLGVYYPNGGETQRVGIQPDRVVRPTIQGLRSNRDELLEQAIRYAGGQQP